ncbi:PA2169 family four-helix-bundle protein [Planctomicrobium sp. SH664]|uniref:PA2169 family four-helix-bundle protein n=1 Tax=Planctomicrobium sp. SH664 TaxID=3448125 RepID=UPI003F5C5038
MPLESKTDLREETLEQIQDLIQTNIDSRDGFRHAASAIEDLNLSTLFHSLATQREEQANELSRYVEWNHEQPRREGSFAAALHRHWMTIRESLSTNNLYTVLAEAERGEDQIKTAYEEALRATAGSAMNDVLLRQYAQVKGDHDRIRDLREEYKSA